MTSMMSRKSHTHAMLLDVEYDFIVKTIEEAVSKLALPENYVWRNIPEELVEEIADDIEASGRVKVPIIVDREFVIIDGVLRYHALRRLYEGGVRNITVPIIVIRNVSYRENPRRAIVLAYTINRLRRGTCDTMMRVELLAEMIMSEVAILAREVASKNPDKVRLWLNDLENGIIPRELTKTISRDLGISESLVHRYISMLMLKMRNTLLDTLRQACMKNETSSLVKEQSHTVVNSVQCQTCTIVDSECGCDDNVQKLEEKSTSIEVPQFRVEVLPPSKADLIRQIRDKIPDVDIDKLATLPRRELREIAKKVTKAGPEELEEVKREIEEKLSSVEKSMGEDVYRGEVYAVPEYFTFRERLGEKLREVETRMHALLYEMFLRLLDHYDVDTVARLVDSWLDAAKSRDPNRLRAVLETYINYIEKLRT